MEEALPGEARANGANHAHASHDNHQSTHDQGSLTRNFSRKRAHHTEEDEADPSQDAGLDGHAVHTPKRSRSSKWPQPSDATEKTQTQQEPDKRISTSSSISRRPASTPGRSSRFQEASMNDRASDKPPSAFTRLFHSAAKNPSVDHLMEDYVAVSSGPATVRQPGRAAGRPMHLRGLTHHKTPSSIATAATSDSRQSSLFRFGRSLASSFNPVNIWQKMATNWREARDELVDERTKEFMERQAKAEHAYAQLKRTGQIGPQGTLTAMTTGLKPVEVVNASPATHRDSGISMDDVRVSTEYNSNDVYQHMAGQAQPAIPERTVHRKPSFHIRTPSLTNLKKAKSEVSLKPKHASLSVSPEKELPQLPDANRSLRKAQSKKDLMKQQKLTKRVSDLETKLQEARRELVAALNDAPPVPPLPVPFKPTPFKAEPKASLKVSTPSPSKKNFVPGALQSVPSERLLYVDQLDERSLKSDHEFSLQNNASTAPEKGAAHRSKKHAAHTDPPKAVPTNLTPPTASDVLQRGLPISDSAPREDEPDYLSTAERSRRSPLDGPADPIEPARPKKTAAKKTTTRKRKPSASKNDLGFRPSTDSGDDDEWAAAAAPAHAKPAKKKRAGARPKRADKPVTTAPRTARRHTPQAPDGAAAAAAAAAAVVVPTTPDPAPAPAPAPSPQREAEARSSLETVEEESSMTITVLLNEEPARPTAFATPAHRGERRSFEWPDDVF